MRCNLGILSILAIQLLCVVVAIAEAEEKSAGAAWRTLPLIKDGKVDSNWVQIGWGEFVVDGESLRTECDPKGMGLLLYKPQAFGNCQIRVVYKSLEPKSNAGVFIRIDLGVLEKLQDKPAPVKRDDKGKLVAGAMELLQEASEKERGPWYAVHHGYEVQICDQADANHRTGAIYSLSKAEPLPSQGSSPWRTMIITLKGNLVSVEVDGKKVSEFDSASEQILPRKNWFEPKREAKRPTVGYIGLQNHDPGDVVNFKEVSVRPIP